MADVALSTETKRSAHNGTTSYDYDLNIHPGTEKDGGGESDASPNGKFFSFFQTVAFDEDLSREMPLRR